MSSDRWNNKWPLLWGSQQRGFAAAAGDDVGCLRTPFGTSASHGCLYTSLWCVWRNIAISRRRDGNDTVRINRTPSRTFKLFILNWPWQMDAFYTIWWIRLAEILLYLCKADLLCFCLLLPPSKLFPRLFSYSITTRWSVSLDLALGCEAKAGWPNTLPQVALFLSRWHFSLGLPAWQQRITCRHSMSWDLTANIRGTLLIQAKWCLIFSFWTPTERIG